MKTPNAVFIAGTDTGVGKTVITRLLSRYLSQKGYSVATQKWVVTGASKKKESVNLPYSFKFASSPHLAARLEKRKIDIKKIKKSLETLSKRFDFVVIEGTGGLLVPLNERTLLIDVVKSLKLPVILVSANSLGAINHTLLSVEALEKRKIRLVGIIFNSVSRHTNKLISEDNPKIVKKFAGKIPIWINGWKKT